MAKLGFAFNVHWMRAGLSGTQPSARGGALWAMVCETLVNGLSIWREVKTCSKQTKRTESPAPSLLKVTECVLRRGEEVR